MCLDFLPEPSVFVSYPHHKTIIKHPENLAHFRKPELPIVIYPTSYLGFKQLGNVMYRKLHHSVNFQLIQGLTYTLSPFVTDGWSKSQVGSSPLRSEEHTSELQSRPHLVCRLLLEKKKT